jgi:rubredoxin
MREQTLYECIGCGHFYHEPVSSCDCNYQALKQFEKWVAVPEEQYEALVKGSSQ